jgi:hypothetical protein
VIWMGAYDADYPEVLAPAKCGNPACVEPLDETLDRCEECRIEFCSAHLARCPCGLFRLCAQCVARERSVIEFSALQLSAIVAKAQQGKFFTDVELREAVRSWSQE